MKTTDNAAAASAKLLNLFENPEQLPAALKTLDRMNVAISLILETAAAQGPAAALAS